MNDTIIDNINSIVNPDDTLWHLGDFAFANYAQAKGYRDRIKCQNVKLVFGNHDKPEIKDLFSDCYLRGGGGKGTDIPQPLEITEDGVTYTLWLDHYPKLTHDWLFLLHGHVHGNIRKDRVFKEGYCDTMILDVGVDGPDRTVYNHKNMPWSLPEIAEFMKEKHAKFR